MVATDGSWVKLNTEQEMNTHGNGSLHSYRVRRKNWQGPGWYYVTTYYQRCPRNCCDDDVIEFTTVKDRIEQIKESRKELLQEYLEARAKL